jgi:hypothetical protein
VNKTAYLVASILAIGGGYFAGRDHDGAREGALRGVVGGSLFGGFILIVHEATGKAAKAKLPHPSILLLVITVGGGVILGALGGRARHQAEEAGEKERKGFSLARLEWSEYLGFAGAAVLFGSLFLPWFSTACDSVHPSTPAGCNVNSRLHGLHGTFSAFQTYTVLDILLVAACAAPFILAYIIAREHELTWRPGEVTMIVGMLAGALILLNGVILGRPGDSVDISIEPGYIVGLIGTTMILAGGVLRQALYSGARKPPGVF